MNAVTSQTFNEASSGGILRFPNCRGACERTQLPPPTAWRRFRRTRWRERTGIERRDGESAFMPDFSLLLSLIHSETAVRNCRRTDIHLKRLSLWKQVNVCSLGCCSRLMLICKNQRTIFCSAQRSQDVVRPTNGGRLAAIAASCLRGRPFPEFPPENTERATVSEGETTEWFSLR